MIYAKSCGAPQQYSNRHDQTIQSSDVKKMSQKDRKTAVSTCLQSERRDSFIDKKLILSQFLENKD